MMLSGIASEEGWPSDRPGPREEKTEQYNRNGFAHAGFVMNWSNAAILPIFVAIPPQCGYRQREFYKSERRAK